MCVLRGPDHVFEFCNDAYRRLAGNRDLLGRPVREVFPDGDGQGLHQVLDDVYATGVPHVVNARPVVLRSADGGREDRLLIDFLYQPLFDERGAVTGIFIDGTDVTERNRTTDRFRATTEAVPGLVFVTSSAGVNSFVNGTFCRFAGRPAETLMGDRWREVVHPDDLTATLDAWNEAMAAGRPFEAEYRIRRHDGAWRWHLVRGAPLGNQFEDGWVGTAIDIHERRDIEDRLRASEERLRLATESAEVGFWDRDLVNNVFIWSPRVKAMFGLPADEPASMQDFVGGLHPEDRDATLAAFAEACDPHKRTLYDVEYRTIGRNDGRVRWVATKGRGIFDEQDRCVRVIGTVIEITERRQAEEALRIERDRTRAVVDGMAEGFLVLTHDFHVAEINEEGLRIEGRPREAIVGRHLLDIWPEVEASPVWPTYRRAMTNREPAIIEVTQAGSGGHVWLEMRAYPIEAGLAVFYRDVTERRRAQQELERINAELEERVGIAVEQRAKALSLLHEAQKMESIGQLTGGIAHDFNNLLSAILSNIDLARKRTQDPRALNLLDGAAKGAERGTTLTRRLLAFARRQELRAETVSIPALVADMKDLLARSIGPAITITTDLPDSLPAITVDPNQLELALLNLALNARDAMPDGGSLSFSGRALHLGPDHEVAGLAAGDYVVLTVADTGCGMDEITMRRATEPFFTTKGAGEGTGLGLPMVQGLAVQSGGTLRLSSTVGEGTRVEIWLPQASGPPHATGRERTEAPETPEALRALQVLVVDDDALVGMGTAAMLEDMGHKVIEASSGRAALETIARHPDIDLVLTDQGMPGMTGTDLARSIRALHPELPIIITTGYADLSRAIGPDLPRLDKPFRRDQLASMIDSLTRPRSQRASD